MYITWMWYPWRPKVGIGFPRTGGRKGYKLPWRYQKLNPSPLREQPVLLTAKWSLLPHAPVCPLNNSLSQFNSATSMNVGNLTTDPSLKEKWLLLPQLPSIVNSASSRSGNFWFSPSRMMESLSDLISHRSSAGNHICCELIIVMAVHSSLSSSTYSLAQCEVDTAIPSTAEHTTVTFYQHVDRFWVSVLVAAHWKGSFLDQVESSSNLSTDMHT